MPTLALFQLCRDVHKLHKLISSTTKQHNNNVLVKNLQ